LSNVPLVDLGEQHRQVAAEVAAGFEEVMASTAFVLGEQVAEFEREYAQFSGVEHCVGVANGTDALEMILRATGIGDGDEVILPANSFIATAEAVVRAGARPVLVDSDPRYDLIDTAHVKDAISSRTRAIMPVHLYGQLAPMEELADLAEQHNLTLLEDAAQSQGARRHGRSSGAFGAGAGTSFYPGKNLGAYGDAGAVVTSSAEIAARVRSLRNHGSERKYEHPELGFNSRMDTLQAVVLRAKLKRLADWNAQRRAAADRYAELLGDVEQVTLPTVLPGNEHVWHLYVARVQPAFAEEGHEATARDQVLRALHDAGVGAGIHYPVPIHLQGAFAHLGHRRGDFPAAEAAADRIISLPLYPGITADQQERVAAALRAAVTA
jgi:dTDP-4-amino-4,6-dideoxygalactose transaminase